MSSKLIRVGGIAFVFGVGILIMIGIYKITSPTKKIYIGQSINIQRRRLKYKNLLCKNQSKIYSSLKKHGWEKHKFEIIHECSIEELNDLEVYYINLYNTFESKHGMNLKGGGYSNHSLSKETKAKIKEKRKLQVMKPYTDERRLKISNANKKRVLSDETKRKIGDKSKGRIFSVETRLKMSESQKSRKPRTGFKHSDETKLKMSISKIGNQNGIKNKNR